MDEYWKQLQLRLAAKKAGGGGGGFGEEKGVVLAFEGVGPGTRREELKALPVTLSDPSRKLPIGAQREDLKALASRWGEVRFRCPSAAPRLPFGCPSAAPRLPFCTCRCATLLLCLPGAFRRLQPRGQRRFRSLRGGRRRQGGAGGAGGGRGGGERSDAADISANLGKKTADLRLISAEFGQVSGATPQWRLLDAAEEEAYKQRVQERNAARRPRCRNT